MRFIVLFLLALLLGGCSFKTPPNKWEYAATRAFESYKTNRLAQKDLLAKSDLKRAKEAAKSSSDLRDLASIELGVCALDIALGKPNNCSEFEKIRPLIECPKLQNYALFLQKKWYKIETDQLPKKYRDFTEAMQANDAKKANLAIQKMQDPISAMVALALLGGAANKESIETTLKKVSFHGYKAGVIHLLQLLEKKTSDTNEKRKIEQKLEILKEKDM